MNLITNIIVELFPIIIIGLCLWLGARHWTLIDKLSRKIFGVGLDD